MKADKFQINLDNLPKSLQEELHDFYQHLLSKYRREKLKKSKQKDFFDLVKKHKFSLPKDYQFDRNLANER